MKFKPATKLSILRSYHDFYTAYIYYSFDFKSLESIWKRDDLYVAVKRLIKIVQH